MLMWMYKIMNLRHLLLWLTQKCNQNGRHMTKISSVMSDWWEYQLLNLLCFNSDFNENSNLATFVYVFSFNVQRGWAWYWIRKLRLKEFRRLSWILEPPSEFLATLAVLHSATWCSLILYHFAPKHSQAFKASPSSMVPWTDAESLMTKI